jgi:hypothetical protein
MFVAAAAAESLQWKKKEMKPDVYKKPRIID